MLLWTDWTQLYFILRTSQVSQGILHNAQTIDAIIKLLLQTRMFGKLRFNDYFNCLPPPLSFYFAVLSFLLFSTLLFFSAFQSTWLKGFMELALQTAQKKKRVHIGKRQIHYKSLKRDSGHWLICHRDTFLCDSFPRAFMCQLIPTSQRLSSISRVKRWAWDDASARPVSGDSLQLLKTDCVH